MIQRQILAKEWLKGSKPASTRRPKQKETSTETRASPLVLNHLALTHESLETQMGVRIGRASSVHHLGSYG
jgi:hypothetical protein